MTVFRVDMLGIKEGVSQDLLSGKTGEIEDVLAEINQFAAIGYTGGCTAPPGCDPRDTPGEP